MDEDIRTKTLKKSREKAQEENSKFLTQKELQQASQKRAKEQPFFQRILKTFSRSDKVFREIIFNSHPFECRVALLEDGILENFEIEQRDKCRMVGAIFKGKIQNLETGLQAAFVNIGQEKNAFLHYWDALPAANDTIETVRVNISKKTREQRRYTAKDIPKLYPINSEIMVQIVKDQIGTKGPRVTTNIALPGRFIVLMPLWAQCGISKKIEDSKERQRLKTILQKLTVPEGMGVVIRTAGAGKKVRYFIRDLHILLQKWAEIQEAMRQSEEPTLLYQEPDMVARTVRDFLTEDIDRIMVDDQEDFQKITELVGKISNRCKSKITCFEDNIPIFERFNVESQIEQTFLRHVPLSSGGALVIDEAEALTAIDVNTSGHRPPENEKENQNFIYQVNAEAAREIVRQMRLRNIGGLIVIDFVDMKSRHDRDKIYALMSELLDLGKSRNQVLPISALGIMQVTRQRHSQSTASDMRAPCPYCQGKGYLKSPRTMSSEIQRKIISLVKNLRQNKDHRECSDVRVLVHPQVLERLQNEDVKYLSMLEEKYKICLNFCPDSSYHVEDFKILDNNNRVLY